MAAIASPIARSSVHETGVSGPYSTAIGTTRRDSDTGPFQRAKVVLHVQASHRPARELWSDTETGEYQFQYIAAGTYYAITIDPLGLKNGDIITDIVVPTP
jgi:hypothetical protein